ncbi:hypothetical protein EG327_005791 [Venturia inaequalis]|uniref:RING-type domain-containing protein n=1 Tax=Venturia inaequalis TaxID=5025 RepID=A0A8H3V5Y7_VENIN|nr:hypothetical protein EG327_005791 [Venturia inaequalis]
MGQTASIPTTTDTTPGEPNVRRQRRHSCPQASASEELRSGSKRVTPRHNRKYSGISTYQSPKKSCDLCSLYHGNVAAVLPRIKSTRTSPSSTSSHQPPPKAAPKDSAPVRDKRRRTPKMNDFPQIQTPEAATRLIKRRDKAVFEVQSALQMLGKHGTENETNLVHLSSEDLRRLEHGLNRVRNLLDKIAANVEPFDSKLATKLLEYKTVIVFNTAGLLELGKTRAMLQHVGKNLRKVRTCTSARHVGTSTRHVGISTRISQHEPKSAITTLPRMPPAHGVDIPWDTHNGDAGSNIAGSPALHLETWCLGSESSITSRTARSSQFAGPSNGNTHCLSHRPNTIRTIHTTAHHTLSDASSHKFSGDIGKSSTETVVRSQAPTSSDSSMLSKRVSMGKGKTEKDPENTASGQNRSTVNFSRPLATPSGTSSPPPGSGYVRPRSLTGKRNAWNGSPPSHGWQDIMEEVILAQAKQEVQSEPVFAFSLTVLPAATDEASYMQLSHVDIIEFAVVDADRNPVAGFTWITSAPAGSLKMHDAECTTTVRNHAAAKLKADPRAICLWFTAVPVEPNRYGPGDSITLSKKRVNVFLDPYIRLIVGDSMHTVDYSKRMTTEKIPVNRACVTVAELRKRAYTQLGIHKKQRFKLSYQGITLKDDKVELKDACSLTQRILQGWDPLYITVTIERRRDCVVCGDELSLSRFSHRPITSSCSHECNSCRKCVREWIKSSLNNNGPDKLTCTECPSPLEHADVKFHASSRQFERYDTLLTRAVITADPDFHWNLRK